MDQRPVDLLHARGAIRAEDLDLETAAKGNGLGGALEVLVRAAERGHGGELVSPAELARFRSGAPERRLFAVQLGSGAAADRTLAGGSGGRRRRVAGRINRTLWQRLYLLAEQRFSLNR